MVAASTSVLGADHPRATGVAPTTPPPVDPGATTTVVAIAPESTVTATIAATLPPPENEAADPIRTLVPGIAVVPAVLTDEAALQAAIGAALAAGGTTVAVEAEPGTLCAVVPTLAPVMA
ncbi:MAG: hypothetical protein M3431_00200, partial [Actinomycetota bacterium]|nr:hypothetical protein [Actinomycetota bacterium]